MTYSDTGVLEDALKMGLFPLQEQELHTSLNAIWLYSRSLTPGEMSMRLSLSPKPTFQTQAVPKDEHIPALGAVGKL